LYSFVLLCFLCTATVYANDEFKDVCEYMASGDYADALPILLQLEVSAPYNANFKYLIGVCYLNLPAHRFKCFGYLDYAADHINPQYAECNFNEYGASPKALFYLGVAFRNSYSYGRAYRFFSNYAKYVNENDAYEIIRLNQEMRNCQIAPFLIIKSPPLIIKLLEGTANNAADNFNPIMAQGNFYYMSSEKFYDALYSIPYNDLNAKPLNLTNQLKSDGEFKLLSVSQDNTCMLFCTFSMLSGDDIYFSTFTNDKWSQLKPLQGINTEFSENYASFSSDGKTIYFSSNRNGGYGGYDLYSCDFFSEGYCSEIKNLSWVLNSPLDEICPFFNSDGSILYFSSNSYDNIGGFDVFYSYRLKNTFSSPVNMGYPINTANDDIFFFPIDSMNMALTARFDSTANGGFDIFTVQVNELNKPVSLIDSFIITPVWFAFKSDKLTDYGRGIVEKWIHILKTYPGIKIELTGYTDRVGSEAYNIKLSNQRALEVKNYMILKGITADRISTRGLGYAKPLIPEKKGDAVNSDARRLNRRVEMVVVSSDMDVIIKKRF